MNNINETIGIGISTCNRPSQLKKLLHSLNKAHSFIDYIVIVNDGLPLDDLQLTKETLFQNEQNLGVAKTKNKSLNFLMSKSCDHMFLIEDDIFVKDVSVFERYIQSSKLTGIQHFNYSQHGLCNKLPHTDNPNPRLVVDYGEIKLPFFVACVGAFSYYSKLCIEKVGGMDELFYNACEHVEHTHRIHLAGMHPPFWWYPDIENSQQYLGDEPWSLQQSLISSRSDRETIWSTTDKRFQSLHGFVPRQMLDTEFDIVAKQLKQIKANFSK